MEARFSAPVQTGPGAHTASCTMCTGSFPEVKCGRGVTLTPHPLLVPWSRKSSAIPLLPLWAVRPLQSLSACTRVNFTLPYFYYNNKYMSRLSRAGSSVGIATGYGLDGPGSNHDGDETFRPSRPALGPNQLPVRWVPGLSRG